MAKFDFDVDLADTYDSTETVSDFYRFAKEYGTNELAPLNAGLVKKNEFPAEQWEGLSNFHAMTLPAAYGGDDDLYYGKDNTEKKEVYPDTINHGGHVAYKGSKKYSSHLAAMEGISYGSGSVGLSYIAHSNLCMNQIMLNGTEEQKKKFLPKLATGEFVGALAMSESGAGSDVMSMKTNAVRSKDGKGWVLNGQKLWITNGGKADVIVLYAKMPDGKLTAFLVEPKKMPGFKAGDKADKMGMRGSETYELTLEDCVIPDENVLGEVGGGEEVLKSGLNYERLLLSGGPLGIAKAAIDSIKEYLAQRAQFGMPLDQKQAIAHEIARMESRYRMAKSYAYAAAAKADEGQLTAPLAASVFYETSDMANDITSRCITLGGGMGYTNEKPWAQYDADAKLYEIGGGARHIRLEIIAGFMKKEGAQANFAEATKTSLNLDNVAPELQGIFSENGPLKVAEKAFNETLKLIKADKDADNFINKNQDIAHQMANLYSRILMVTEYAQTVAAMPHNDAQVASLKMKVARMVSDVTEQCVTIASPKPEESSLTKDFQSALSSFPDEVAKVLSSAFSMASTPLRMFKNQALDYVSENNIHSLTKKMAGEWVPKREKPAKLVVEAPAPQK